MSATESETDKTKEIPLGWKLPVEFTKIKKDIANSEDQGKRIVTQSLKVRWKGAKYTFIQRGSNFHFVDTQALMWVEKSGKRKGYWKLRYDENICEPLGADGKAVRSPTVSTILRDESMMQLVQIAQQFLPLTITKQMLIVVAIFGVMAGLVGLGINEVFHTAPTTAIHWLPSKPKGIP